jgi:phage shock protein C
MYRNRSRGMLFGVCAGVADYFGFDLTVTRILVVVGLMFFFPAIALIYLLLALLLPVNPAGSAPSDPNLNRRVRSEPHATLDGVRLRFRELDARLQSLERYVTSGRFKLDSEFEKLKE